MEYSGGRIGKDFMDDKNINYVPICAKRPTWRVYQENLKRKKTGGNRLKYLAFFSVLCAVLLAWMGGFGWRTCGKAAVKPDAGYGLGGVGCASGGSLEKAAVKPDAGLGHRMLEKKDLRILLENQDFLSRTEDRFSISRDGHAFRVETSLNTSLQRVLIEKLDVVNCRYVGIVVMDPDSGRILAMTGFDKTEASSNPCTGGFPAASIFKIVTAAACIESCGYNPQTVFAFNGGKHTLYKHQLRDREDRYSQKITLKNAFAQSVNPVFGKIGALRLVPIVLEKHAEAFGFNHDIDFELPVSLSRVVFSEEPYRLAEVSCGFNRDTTISPLHGAMLSSAVFNRGQLIAPGIIDAVVDENGKTLYRHQPEMIGRATSPETSRMIGSLMEETVSSGTCRKAFSGYRSDKTLSRLNLGGKTGSIDNASHDVRLDWFVGFARDKNGPGRLAVSVVVGHERYIGTRASQYARIAIREYFSNYFSQIAGKAEDRG